MRKCIRQAGGAHVQGIVTSVSRGRTARTVAGEAQPVNVAGTLLCGSMMANGKALMLVH